MSDFDEDINTVKGKINDWIKENGIRRVDEDTMDSELEKYTQIRSDAFKQMVENYNNSDHWKDCAQKGFEAINHLNVCIPSMAAEAFKAFGLEDFYQKEKKAWQSCQDAIVPLISLALTTIKEDDNRLIEQLEKSLTEAINDAQAANELFRISQRGPVQGFSDFIAKATTKVIEMTASDILHLPGKLIGMTASVVDIINKTIPQWVELQQRRKSFRQVLINNGKQVDDMWPKINDGSVTDLVNKGTSWINSLGDGDYKRDWDTFGKMIEDKLHTQAIPISERAHYLYETVRVKNLEGLTKTFATLLGTRDELIAYKGQLSDLSNKLFDALETDDKALATISGGAVNSARADMEDIKKKVTEQVQKLYDQLKNAENNN